MSNRAEPDTPHSPSPLRRERAPTITIDTSAVNSTQASNQEEGRGSSSESTRPGSSSLAAGQLIPSISPTELRPSPSLEGREYRESRPTSPHNVSSPTSKWIDSTSSNFLAVPGARSRGNSLDSEDAVNSSSLYGGDTVALSSSATDTPIKGSPEIEDITKVKDALAPDPGTEADFEVENNKFAFSPGQLNKMLNPKSLAAFYALGGLAGIEQGLRTNRDTGLSFDESLLDGTVSFEEVTRQGGSPNLKPNSHSPPPRVDTAHAESVSKSSGAFLDRKRIFSDNRLPAKKTKSILELAWIAYNDKVLILLSVAAVISLALGIYEAVTAKPGEPRVQWVEGVAIMVAILVVVVVGALNDWKKEQQFVKLNKKKEDRKVKVIRSGKSVEISVFDVLAGDVMHLEPGDLVPVDGIFIEGHNVKCDESSATGESDLLRKVPGDEVYRAIDNHESLKKLDPFILSGSKVSEGVGTFLVTATGVNSSHGKTLLSLQEEGQTTPLQSKLNILAEYIAKLGLAAGLLLFVVLFIKFLVRLRGIEGGSTEKGQAFLRIFIVAVTVIVVAVPEGLPLAVTLALAFATTRMLKDNNLVRLLRACETMGNATTICSDKTGTLTQNKMTVVAGTFGTASRFGDNVAAASSGPDQSENSQGTADSSEVPPAECIKTLSSNVKNVLKQSIALNSTAFEAEEDGEITFVGSKTETALLGFARDYLGLGSLNEERSNSEVVQLVPFDSGRKCMATVIKLQNGKYRMLVKGASEILISKCSRILRDPTADLSDIALSEKHRSTLNSMVMHYASQSLRTIGLVYNDYEQWPPRGVPTQEDDRRLASFDAVFKDLVFLGVVGIQDPLRPGVAASVRQCQKAGVFVRMVTGDNIITAKAIAQSCGIFTAGGIAMEGPKFRKLSSYQMNQIIPRLQVLARSSPEDKRILVSRLQKLGETVAVTGDGTNDAPALKGADVGFSMGIAGTEVAKEASAIILMDDNFNSIVKAMAWGRTVNDAVKKFLQFQITVNITAVFLTFISSVASNEESSVLTAVQLLWVNLIMDTFAALALATDPPPDTILDRKPEPKSAPLITPTMWKMIIGQSIYQLVVTLILNFAGKNILNYGHSKEDEARFRALIFNTFVWMQIFNQYNSRRIDNQINIFEGLLSNKWFIAIQFIITGGQVLIIFVGRTAFAVRPLNGTEWGVSVILGLISLPVAIIIRLIPDEFLRKLIPRFWSRKPRSPRVFVSDEDQRYEWNPALEEIRDQLQFLKTVRGGRLNHLKYKLQHPETLLPRSRSGSRSRDHSVPPTPQGDNETEVNGRVPSTPDSRMRNRGRSRSNSAFGPAAAMAGIVAGSIAGWSPVERAGGENDSIKFSRSGPGALDQQEGIEIHPDTRDDDPVVSDYSTTSKIPPSQNPDLVPDFMHASSSNLQQPRRSNSRQSASRHSATSSAGNQPKI
ncbi:calcium-translocating P-type ATPase, PMCA-type [Coccidioides immitis RS]|uniref:Calcium-transporting ATPase n=1 Tax=Coccidioides immitis (strain RS) TaxID=246410 RepID=J3K990_COCIM|nr:calcium-translocating P-type ATPase, PMCA-type [Coccidioides immitis RS]EAS31446.3 calcium-translocating P-type ATPase, PMCA-type [Coccidioides immitis RS]